MHVWPPSIMTLLFSFAYLFITQWVMLNRHARVFIDWAASGTSVYVHRWRQVWILQMRHRECMIILRKFNGILQIMHGFRVLNP